MPGAKFDYNDAIGFAVSAYYGQADKYLTAELRHQMDAFIDNAESVCTPTHFMVSVQIVLLKRFLVLACPIRS